MMSLLIGAAMLAADTNHFVICATLPPTADTTSQTVYGRAADPFTHLTLPVGFTGGVAEAVRAKMTIPDTLPIVVFDAQGRPTVVVTGAFSLTADGSAKNVAVMASSSSAEIDSMLTKGIEKAAKDSSLPPLPPRAGSGIRLAFTLSTDSAAGAVPMFSIRLPAWRAYAYPQSPTNKTQPRPLYTAVRGESDTVEISVIVDQRGVPLLGTAHIERAPERTFALTYLDWFRESRFVPGHIQRCAVRSLVHLKGTITVEDKFIPAP